MCERCNPRGPREMPSSDAPTACVCRTSDRLRRALAVAFKTPGDAAAHVGLHDAMCEHVALLKDQGVAAGRVLFELKQIVASVEKPSSELFGPADFVQSAMSHCIDNYYDRWIASDRRGELRRAAELRATTSERAP
jgi:hypothetical protein